MATKLFCLGGNVFGWMVPEPDSLRRLDPAAAPGLTFIHTAAAVSGRGNLVCSTAP